MKFFLYLYMKNVKILVIITDFKSVITNLHVHYKRYLYDEFL
jgi:hypothetical protein